MPLDLKEIKARCEAATEGPWSSYDPCDIECSGLCTPSGCQGHKTGKHVLDGPPAYNYDEEIRVSKEDGKFISHARTDLPACIAEIERLQKLVEAAYREGSTDGDVPTMVWDNSDARKALEQA